MGVKTEVDVLTESTAAIEAARAKAEDGPQQFTDVCPYGHHGDRGSIRHFRVPCTEKNTDIGSLKGIMVARAQGLAIILISQAYLIRLTIPSDGTWVKLLIMTH